MIALPLLRQALAESELRAPPGPEGTTCFTPAPVLLAFRFSRFVQVRDKIIPNNPHKPFIRPATAQKLFQATS
jgi:hypothetical protein